MKIIHFICALGTFAIVPLVFWLMWRGIPPNFEDTHWGKIWLACLFGWLGSAFLMNLRAGGSSRDTWKISGLAWCIDVTILIALRVIAESS